METASLEETFNIHLSELTIYIFKAFFACEVCKVTVCVYMYCIYTHIQYIYSIYIYTHTRMIHTHNPMTRDTHRSAAVVSMVTAWSRSQSSDWKRGAPPKSSPN